MRLSVAYGWRACLAVDGSSPRLLALDLRLHLRNLAAVPLAESRGYTHHPAQNGRHGSRRDRLALFAIVDGATNRIAGRY
jgi:hypothetical protein